MIPESLKEMLNLMKNGQVLPWYREISSWSSFFRHYAGYLQFDGALALEIGKLEILARLATRQRQMHFDFWIWKSRLLKLQLWTFLKFEKLRQLHRSWNWSYWNFIKLHEAYAFSAYRSVCLPSLTTELWLMMILFSFLISNVQYKLIY